MCDNVGPLARADRRGQTQCAASRWFGVAAMKGRVKARGNIHLWLADGQLPSGTFVCPAAWVRDVMSPLEVVALR